MLYFKAMPNSIDFYKGIFLHIIPVQIIVPCPEQDCHKRKDVCAAVLVFFQDKIKHVVNNLQR